MKRQSFGSSLIASLLGGVNAAMEERAAMKRQDRNFQRDTDRRLQMMRTENEMRNQLEEQNYQKMLKRKESDVGRNVDLQKKAMEAWGITPDEMTKVMRKRFGLDPNDGTHFSKDFVFRLMGDDLEGAAKVAKTDKEIVALIEAKKAKDNFERQFGKPRWDAKRGAFVAPTLDGGTDVFDGGLGIVPGGRGGRSGGGGGGGGGSGSDLTPSQQRLASNDKIENTKKLRDMLAKDLESKKSAYEAAVADAQEKARKALWFNGVLGGPDPVSVPKPQDLVDAETQFGEVDQAYREMLRGSLGTPASKAKPAPQPKPQSGQGQKKVSPAVQQFLEMSQKLLKGY